MKKNMQFIMGKNTLFEVAKHVPFRLKKVYIAKSLQNKQDKLVNLLIEKKIEISFVDKKKLFSFVKSDSHQSFVAEVYPRNFLSLEDFLKKDFSRLLVLDSIVDPQNMGSLLRTAECFSFDAVMFCKNRGSAITPVVTKASCGAVELVPLIRVSNLVESLKKIQKESFEIIVADTGENAEDFNNLCYFGKKIALVMGSENKGAHFLVKKIADKLTRIPMQGKIDSLNVSQAAAIFCCFLQMKKT